MKRVYQCPTTLCEEFMTESFLALSHTIDNESAQEVARGREFDWEEDGVLDKSNFHYDSKWEEEE